MSTISAGNTINTAFKVTADTTGGLIFTTGGANTTALTLSNAQAATFAGAVSVTGNATVSGNTSFTGSVNAPNTFGFKNRIINGAMMIDQRSAGANTTVTTTGYYSCDRWVTTAQTSSKYSVQQNSGSVTPPAGFTNYLGIISLSSYSVSSSEWMGINQRIEGLNIADFAWGTANAKTVTLSFWVRSSLTGTFGGSLSNSDGSRSYPYSYTISSANTWEQKSITIAGDTTGTWLTTNGIGIRLNFGIGVGSNFLNTAGVWAAGEYYGATGEVSVVGTSGATFYITGVQFELGSQATSFDYRSITTEAALCQRYFCKSFNLTTAPANGGGGTSVATYIGAYLGPIIRPNYTPFPGGATDSTTPGGGCVTAFISFPVTMRATPTITSYGNSSGQWHYIDGSNVSGYATCTSGGGNVAGTAGFQGSWSSIINVGSASAAAGHWTASAEL